MSQDVEPSQTQNEVSRVLTSLGWNHEVRGSREEHRTGRRLESGHGAARDEGRGRVRRPDALPAGRRLWSHYTKRRHSRSREGSCAILGWEVISIPYLRVENEVRSSKETKRRT